MKKVILAITLFFTIQVARSQQTSLGETFSAYSSGMEQKLQHAAEIKDRKALLSLMSEWLDHYSKQPANIQAVFKGYLQNVYYNQACTLALEGHKALAIANFQQAVNAGYKNYALTLKDSDLVSLKKDKRFKKALQQMRTQGDYIYLLKQSGKYNANAYSASPEFTYQAASSPELTAFRTKFNLDSVIGNGDELSRIKNLMSWVHNKVRHDGNSNNPQSKNAIDLIEVCRRENRGVNCRMLATILKDAYQAEGFPSRAVTCLPKDTTDFDCHVINIVWSKSLGKWLWMDPTNNAYVSDDRGNLLGIEEVRERLVKNKPLVLNDDANWNNRQKQTKEYYLDYYMAKNLFWLQCPLKSEWDLETRGVNKAQVEYVNLYPGYYTTIGGRNIQTTKSQKMYATGNPEFFWEKP